MDLIKENMLFTLLPVHLDPMACNIKHSDKNEEKLIFWIKWCQHNQQAHGWASKNEKKENIKNALHSSH